MTVPTPDRTRPQVFLDIAGNRRAEGSGGVHDHIDPATGEVDAQVPLAGPSEIEEAVQAAHDAYGTWRRTKPAERRAILLRLAELIEQHAEEFGRLGVLDNGTPISTSNGAAGLAAEWTRYYAGWADKIQGETTATIAANGELGLTLKQPYGVIGIIVTWNGPLVSLGMKIPAALAAGNTVVVKPSELTPFSGQLFVELARRAGLPAGALSILPGDAAAGAALVAHPLVKKVSFTGGAVTAEKILVACARTMKPAVLELGGKSANIVFEDADLDVVCMHGTFMSVGLMSGQGCSFPTRMLVHRPIYDEVCERVVDLAKNLAVGDPWDPSTVAGPLINQAAVDRVLSMIEQAEASGARRLLGGSRLGGELAGGYFVEPTVFADVDPDSALAQEEVFGPVLSIIPFDTEEDAIRIANSTRFGLSGYVQTKDVNRALRVAEEMETGEVLVNGGANLAVHRPFGGIGLSGVGKEGGRAGLEEFLRIKGVGIGNAPTPR